MNLNLKYIVIIGNVDSLLVWEFDICLCIGYFDEVCVLGMIFIILIIVMIVIGDILVVEIMKKIGFIIEEYSKCYYGGYLGECLCELSK